MRLRIRYVSYIKRNKKRFAVFFAVTATLMLGLKLFTADIRPQCHQSYTTAPIDVVYTWVNGSDERFLSDLKHHLSSKPEHSFDASQQRFCDKYELKFSLRSLQTHAPWVRHVYIVTNGQIPYWLNLDAPHLTVITHSDIFPSPTDLPTFSSPAIETHLHRIKGLSKRFIYMNDDVFFGAPVYPDDFISDSRGFLVYLSWPVPPCNGDCPWLYVSDGQCDQPCLTASCQMDGGDCDSRDGNSDQLHYGGHIEYEHTHTVRYLYELDEQKRNNTRLNITSLLRLNNTNSLANVVDKLNSELILLNKLTRKGKKARHSKRKRLNSTTPAPSIDKNQYDAFSESLQYCNRLFNSRYGFKTRYVAAHAPILIDTDIMNALQRAFRNEFAITSRHKLRTGTDLQYSFTYYNYVITQLQHFNSDYVFDVFDTDRSGTWSDREIRTVLTRLYDLPLDFGVIDHFEMVLMNCSRTRDFPVVSTPLYERYLDSTLPTITKEMIVGCPALMGPLWASVGANRRPRYPHTIIRGSDTTSGDSTYHQTNPVTFKMLTSNLTGVITALDNIRRKPTKFVCINDNLDPSKVTENELIVSVLYDFYLSIFPLPSKFELAPELRNRFLHVDELARWRHRNLLVKTALSACVILLVCTLVLKRCRFPFRILTLAANKVV